MVVTKGANGNGVRMTPAGEKLASPSRVREHDMSVVAPSVVDSESAATASPQANEGLYLLGRPTLKRFIRHVNYNAVNPPDEGTLVEEWQAAHRALLGLEKDEAGFADNPRITKMGPEYEPQLIELLKNPLIRNGFNTVPTEIALVDLEQMVVYQKHIDITFASERALQLSATPSDAEIFRVCLPSETQYPPVRWSGVSSDKFVFVSPSNDLRFLGVMPLEPGHVTGCAHPGSLVGVVGAAVGFGSNFLNAVYVENRLILRNGSHRAYALFKRGCRRVPCIIQHVRSRDELELVGSSELTRHPDLYLRHPRPPMLKDYFHPALHKAMSVHRRLHQVTVSFSVEQTELPAL